MSHNATTHRSAYIQPLLPRLASKPSGSSSGHATPAALHRAVVVQTPQLSRCVQC